MTVRVKVKANESPSPESLVWKLCPLKTGLGPSDRKPSFQIGSKVFMAPPNGDSKFKTSKYREHAWCVEGGHWLPHREVVNLGTGKPRCPTKGHGTVRLKPKMPTNRWAWIDAHGELIPNERTVADEEAEREWEQ